MPSEASLIAERPDTDATAIQKMAATLELQRQAFLQDGFVPAATRIDRLRRAYQMVADNQSVITEACNADFGSRSRHQTQMSDVMSTMTALHYSAQHVSKWMREDRRKVDFPMSLFGARAKVINQPKGVVGNISTWNFPFHVALAPLAGIFAAGNRAMIKASEITPASAELTARLVAQYFDESECAVIEGGPEVGAAFASLPFDHLLFTGATSVGRQIMHAAAENLTPVTLELGGKSPVIVGRSYDTEKAAQRIITGKALNMGQVCLSPDYVFVAEENKDAFIAAAKSHFESLFPTIVNNPDYTSVVNARHQSRLQALVDDAESRGFEMHQFNTANEDFKQQPQGLHKLPLTLIVNPSDDARVMQEEIFGPVIAVKTYRHIDDCIQYINAHPRPLGLYYFGNDKSEEHEVLHRTISGGLSINDVMGHVSCEDLPFGGVGHSGMGNYHGKYGFATFSHQKAVFRQSPIDLMKLGGMLPPYGEKCEQQLDKMCTPKKI